MKTAYGVDSMPDTGENVAQDFQVSRAVQDAFALRSQQRAAAAQARGWFAEEITRSSSPTGRDARRGSKQMSIPVLRRLRMHWQNFSLWSGQTEQSQPAMPRAQRWRGRDVRRKRGRREAPRDEPSRAYSAWPSAASRLALWHRPGPATESCSVGLVEIDQLDAIELDEAFASQGVAVLRGLGLPDDDPRVNPNGGAIALGHPLGMSGARLVQALVHQLEASGGRYGLATLCVGVGQGLALVVERT